MTSNELLTICQTHFPVLDWEIDANLNSSTSLTADLAPFINGQIILDCSDVRAWAWVLLDNDTIPFMSERKPGNSPDQALSQLKEQIKAHIGRLTKLIGES